MHCVGGCCLSLKLLLLVPGASRWEELRLLAAAGGEGSWLAQQQACAEQGGLWVSFCWEQAPGLLE